MIARDQVGGSGVLQHLHSGLQLTVEDAARLMIIISDNTATNLLLDKVPMRAVWAKMDSLGLPPRASTPRPSCGPPAWRWTAPCATAWA